MEIDQPWLDNGAEVLIIDLKDTIHATEDDEDAPIHGNSSATQTSSSTTRDNRYVVTGRNLDESCYLLGVCWQHHHIRSAPINGGIIFIQCQIIRRVQNMTRSKQCTQFAD